MDEQKPVTMPQLIELLDRVKKLETQVAALQREVADLRRSARPSRMTGGHGGMPA